MFAPDDSDEDACGHCLWIVYIASRFPLIVYTVSSIEIETDTGVPTRPRKRNMNLSIVLVLVLNFLGTHSLCDNSNKGLCWAWNKVFGDSDDTSREDIQLVVVPSNNCTCVPYYKCNQEDIFAQLKCINAAINDVDPDLVCCRNPVRSTTLRPLNRRTTKKPSHKPQPTTQDPSKNSTKMTSRIPPLQPTTQVPSLTSTQNTITNPPTQISPVTETDCNCMPLSECHDQDFDSNSQHEQGSCPNASDVCCLGLVKPLTTPQSQSSKPSQISPQPQSPNLAQTSPSADKNCICTPFYKCYDEETSSNLTNVVDDRIAIPITEITIPVTEQESCPDPNDICCHNLVKIMATPTISSSSEDCIGSCISIRECPYLLNKLAEAQEENKDAVQELRSSVCSNTNGNLSVCCPPEAEGSPPCQFPFIYKQVTYSRCINKDDPNGELWCSTQTDNQSNHVKDQWRYCTSDEALVAA